MAVEYVNRSGDRYFLQLGKPKKGGHPNYYFARKQTGTPVDTIPEGFEIFEEPERGIVYLRKQRPTSIRPEEKEFVEEMVGRYLASGTFRVECEEGSLVVYTSTQDVSPLSQLMDELGVMSAFPNWRNKIIQDMQVRSPLSKMLRYTLVNASKRHFRVERWCCRSSSEYWLNVMAGSGPLEKVVPPTVKHLGQESFYEMF